MIALDIDGAGYTEASLSLHAGNQWAARYFGVLGDALADTGAMAGDSSFAEPFCEGYDEAALLATETFDNLITSYANLGRYAFTSVENHTRAELASTGDTTLGGLAVTDEPSMLSHTWYDVVPIQVPPSLGGDPSSLPDWANWVLDKIEGFIWPDADLDRLRRAGDTWRTAADNLELVAQNADAARTGLCLIRSPEIPLALNAVNELAQATRDLGAQMTVIGNSCTGYADAVEEQREAVLDLLHDLLRDAVIIQGLGFLAGLVSFGTANFGASAINIAKISAASSRFRAMIEILRIYALESKLALGASSTVILATDQGLRRFVLARMALRGEARIVQDGRSWARLQAAIRNPKTFDPNMLRGISRADLRRMVDGWKSRPARDGVGTVYVDPTHLGRQVRIMQGYPGNRPDSLTHGPYAVISQNSDRFKIPLEGNPTL